MRKPRKKKPLAGSEAIDIGALKEQTTAPAQEVLGHIYKAILKISTFTLQDGTTASIDHYYPPEFNEQSQVECGFDIHLDDGSHLEFIITNTGWGRPIQRSPENRIPPGPSSTQKSN